MRILLMASAYNSLTQRVHAELADRGHEVSVELALGDEVMRDGVRRSRLSISPGTGPRRSVPVPRKSWPRPARDFYRTGRGSPCPAPRRHPALAAHPARA